MTFTGENDIARRVVDARDKGIGATGLEEADGVFEAIGWNEINIWESFGGLLGELVGGDFGKDDFHRLIIAHLDYFSGLCLD